ncbi:MAG TPA: hypothetical protein VJ827_10265 [Rubrobacter sp.]|nr:hypothetical protein [Rubrobacter sp.]
MRTASADRPSTLAIKHKRLSANHADTRSTPATMNAGPSDPTRALAGPSDAPTSGWLARTAKKAKSKTLARMLVAPAA